jgi:large subunit ribosomal protein L5
MTGYNRPGVKLLSSPLLSRSFYSSPISSGKVGVSIKHPVHHTVKFKNSQVSQRYRELLIPKSSVESSGFKPWTTHADRLFDHHHNNIASDLLLINYNHNGVDKKGIKKREWDGSSPYHVFRALRPPRGRDRETKDVKKRDWRNIPEIKAVSLNSYVTNARDNKDLAIAAMLQMQQITGQKPKLVTTRTNIAQFRIRKGMPMGAKVTIKGRPMTQFLSTLSEIVFPRSKTFEGISNQSGDRCGNITFGVSSEEVQLFPELEGNLDLWPVTFGFDVTVHTSAQVDPDARTLLSAYGFVFKEDKETFPSRW